MFETPIDERLLQEAPSREIETWIRLITPTVKYAIADADLFLRPRTTQSTHS
jgi:hypothetical protein